MRRTEFIPVTHSLAELCGFGFADAVCETRAFLTGEDKNRLREISQEAVEFFPRKFQDHLIAMLAETGKRVLEGWLDSSTRGASTGAFDSASKPGMAPLSAFGWYRCGEDGRLYLTTKSEHYHVSLGHCFPGYALLDRARCLGIPNATHNNTRGHITRLLEEELVLAANGCPAGDRSALPALLASREAHVLNRVLNLETGSLAVEAGFKLMLKRFYRMQPDQPNPAYSGRVPVFLVLGDESGHHSANYHGTTILTQTFRGMWPEIRDRLEASGILQVRTVRPNCVEDLEEAFRLYDNGPTKIAGFFHEIVMMNYGGVLLTRDFLCRAYALCHDHDVPTLADEIQSCAWGPQLFLFREYGLRPDMVALGKGFPGGEYAASRILFSSTFEDELPQFGALVTNGQEEIASLAYLVTLRWAQANAHVTRSIGEEYAARLHVLAARFGDIIAAVEGWGHLSTLFLRDLATAKRLASILVAKGLDISVQTYKSDCPPALLTKLPLIAGYEVVDFVIRRLEEALTEVTVPSEVNVAN